MNTAVMFCRAFGITAPAPLIEAALEVQSAPRSLWVIVYGDREFFVISDVGGLGRRSVTNDAERVVDQLAPILNGRRLLYFDSTGRLDELLHDGHNFHGFAPVDADIRQRFARLSGSTRGVRRG